MFRHTVQKDTHWHFQTDLSVGIVSPLRRVKDNEGFNGPLTTQSANFGHLELRTPGDPTISGEQFNVMSRTITLHTHQSTKRFRVPPKTDGRGFQGIPPAFPRWGGVGCGGTRCLGRRRENQPMLPRHRGGPHQPSPVDGFGGRHFIPRAGSVLPRKNGVSAFLCG